jgi:serine/threonine protein kinase
MSAEVTAPSSKVDSRTGAAVLSSNALPIGTRVHEFEITRVIGEGGFSVVYLAFDHTLHRSIALKEYIPSALAGRRGDNTVAVRSAQHQQTFEAGLRSFINEARLLAQFDHPALVKVYRFWEANGTAYMAMPYYEGRTLKEILRENPEQASEVWLKQLLAPILDALELLHRHRCFHRDIAPDNIQVLANESPVLLDFGAARRTIGDMTQAFTVILKPGYAPIEQYADEADLKQGPWTDVYALAAVLYAAVVRKPPPTAVARVIKDPLEPLAKRALPRYSQQFLIGIDRGLAVRPEDRPQSIAEMRRLLDVQPYAHYQMELHSQDMQAAQDRAERPIARASTIPDSSAPASTVPPATAGNPDSTEGEAERERTVLVPGLRSASRSSQSNEDSPIADAGSASGRGWEQLKPQMLSRRVLLGGLACVILIIIAVPAYYQLRVSPPVVAQQTDTSNQSDGTEPKPPASNSSVGNVPSSPALPSGPKSDAETASALAKSGAGQPGEQSPTQQSMPAPSSTAPTGKQTNDRLPSTLPSPSAQRPTDTARPSVSPPPVPADERKWAEIKDSDNLSDFYGFVLRYPKSARISEVKTRIAELEQLQKSLPTQNAANPATPSSTSRPAPEKDANRVAQADSAGRQSSVGTTGKALVRIRVSPFGYVYVDGVEIGASPPPRSIELTQGRHRIEARNLEAHPPVLSTDIDVSGTQPRDVPLRFSE